MAVTALSPTATPGSPYSFGVALARSFIYEEVSMFYIQKGSKSKTIPVPLESSAAAGTGLTGKAFGDVTCYYKREGAEAEVAVTMAAGTIGTWATGGWVEVDATNNPGVYEFGVPDAAILKGADWAIFSFVVSGAYELPPMLVVLTDRVPHGSSRYDHREAPTDP